MPKCVNCGTKENVKKRINPYEEDVNAKIVKEWLCESCVELIAQEI